MKKFIYIYLLKFILCFCILYYGTLAIIGITTPGRYYFAFADHYLDYVSGLRMLLLKTSKFLLQASGYEVYVKDVYTIKMQGGRGVRVVYSCLGYGLISFWLAFVFANKISFWKMVGWMLAGLLIIILLNVFRISLLLIAINRHWGTLFNLDNHTWFNIVAYTFIFMMMYLFDRSEKKINQSQRAG